jgi:hypothetical protein
MPDVTDQATIDIQAQLRRLKSLSQLVADRQSSWEGNTERSNFNQRVQDTIKYCRDDLDPDLETNPGRGAKRTDQESSQFTSRVMTSLEDAADAFCGNLFVPQGWFGYEIMDQRLQGNDDIQAWLQRAEKHIDMAISQANFYPQMPNVAMDALSIGEGLIFVGEDEKQDRAFVHYWESLNTWFIRDHWGQIIAVHHRWTMSAMEAYSRWGTKCSKTVVENAEGNRPAEKANFIQAIYRRSDPMLRGLKFERERPFVEVWIEEDSEKNDKTYSTSEWRDSGMNGILEQGGYSGMPVIDWPYWWKSSETYGRGPMHLVSIKRLHAIWKSTLLGINRAGAPPLLASASLRDLLDLGPDGVTWVKNASDLEVRPVYGNAIDYRGNLELINKAEEDLREMLKLNVFLAMTMKTKEMRVDEVMQVVGEQAAMLSPRIGLLASLFLDTFHQRMWSIEEQRGRLAVTEPPGIIMNYLQAMRTEAAQKGRKFKGLPMRIVYKGPLQVAQDSYFVQRRLAAGLAPIRAYLLDIDPEAVADALDVGIACEEVMDNTGFMQKAVRSKEDRAARQKQRAEAQMMQMQSEAARQQAGALRETAQAAQIAGGRQ